MIKSLYEVVNINMVVFSRDLHSDCSMFFPVSSYKKITCGTAYTTRTLSPYTELGLTSIASFLQNQ